jgi:DNA-binding NarL/FixJ family response regulator
MPSEARSAASNRTGSVRVALVDDDELVLEGLRGMLAPHRDRVEVAGRVPLTEDLRAVVIELGAEIVLTEVRPEGTSALDLAERLASVEPPFQVVIFTYEENETRVLDALRLGASGYLLKSLGGDELVELLVRIGRGEVVVDPTMATRIAMRAAQQADPKSWAGSQLGLSERESEVLALLVDGLANRAIAAQLEVSEETVKTHLRNIYKKLKVKDRAHAVATILRQGLFT